ncbi:hypothetical protein T06_9342 [Trichinella sp. T6]|nr:hypothetical protein T06_9342 [Trichinella sp. T6]
MNRREHIEHFPLLRLSLRNAGLHQSWESPLVSPFEHFWAVP